MASAFESVFVMNWTKSPLPPGVDLNAISDRQNYFCIAADCETPALGRAGGRDDVRRGIDFLITGGLCTMALAVTGFGTAVLRRDKIEAGGNTTASDSTASDGPISPS